MIIFISLLMYILLLCGSLSVISNLAAPLFVALIYILPIVFNLIIVKINPSQDKKLSVILPTLSTIFYILFSYVSMKIGAWESFMTINTIVDGDLTVSIAENPLSVSQIIFAALSYYGVSIVTYIFTNKTMQEDNLV